MKTHLLDLLREARQWLESQPVAERGTAEWYAVNNLRSFIEGIESQPDEVGVQKAVHALRFHIADQFEWSADYCKSISSFCERADRIRREVKHG
ncbi:MAG TPA: hypothetical protein VFS24_04550 [Steroidobacteraceae bacterium]|nr:hypothetical protein [Steroidobacteraceae bacterium]